LSAAAQPAALLAIASRNKRTHVRARFSMDPPKSSLLFLRRVDLDAFRPSSVATLHRRTRARALINIRITQSLTLCVSRGALSSLAICLVVRQPGISEAKMPVSDSGSPLTQASRSRRHEGLPNPSDTAAGSRCQVCGRYTGGAAAGAAGMGAGTPKPLLRAACASLAGMGFAMR
jgi:hypothetical protein